MKQDGLAYQVLSQNPSETLIADIVNYNKLSPSDELCILLWQLNPDTLRYMASIPEHTKSIQEALCYVYDKKTLELLFAQIFKKGIDHCHIATHPFQDKEDLYTFFSEYQGGLDLKKWDIEGLASEGFRDGNIIVSTSMVIPEKKDLFFNFSIAKPVETKEENKLTATIVHKWYAVGHWQGFESLEWYLKNKFPKGESIFALLGLESSDYL